MPNIGSISGANSPQQLGPSNEAGNANGNKQAGPWVRRDEAKEPLVRRAPGNPVALRVQNRHERRFIDPNDIRKAEALNRAQPSTPTKQTEVDSIEVASREKPHADESTRL